MAPVLYTSEPFTFPGGGVAVGVLVRVLFDGTLALAPIYHNILGVRAPNPMRTDELGVISFYAEPGEYSLRVNNIDHPIVVDGSPGAGDEATWALNMSVPGPGGPGTGRNKLYNDNGRSMEVVAVRVTAVDPGGSGLIVDVNKNGASIYTQQANRPLLAAGAGTSTVKNTGFDADVVIEDGDYITVDVDEGTFQHLVVQVSVR